MLAKSVLLGISGFFMQLDKFPAKIHKEIDKLASAQMCLGGDGILLEGCIWSVGIHYASLSIRGCQIAQDQLGE